MEKNGSSAAPSSKRKRRSRGAWLKEVRSLRDSGLSPAEYAAKKGLVLSTLKFWMRVLRSDVEARAKSAVPAFLPVSVLHTARTPPSDAAVMVEIDLANGRRLRMHVRPDADLVRVSDLLSAVEGAFDGYRRLVSQYQLAVKALATAGGHEALVSEIRETEESIDLPYLDANTPGSFESCQDGIARISTIVRAMKQFAHPDQKEKVPADLNQALQTTLAIARNEYKYIAEVTTELGDLPPVLCHVGDLNQVFLNLIVNAAHAIGDVVGHVGGKGTIRIKTSLEGSLARIDIADTGAGIPAAIRQRIFEPFFTTKEVGKGTGQGLAIARSIIVAKHGGSLTFESEVGKGTTFTIRLPIGDNGVV